MELEVFYNTIFKNYRTVSTDSRNITQGCLFFALKGDSFNGNVYAIQSINNGAAFAIVDDNTIIHEQIICVPNVLEFLQDLARFHRLALNIPFIGITGTNGKTTTKELVAAVLESTYNISYTKGNFNNHIGVPLTILDIKDDTDIAIIEMGANHQGEIKALCDIALPDFGIITNVGKAHLEGFGDFETIIKTKTELYKSIKSRNGLLFVDADNSILLEHASDLDSKKYSILNDSNVMGIPSVNEVCATFELVYNGTKNKIESQLFGEYNIKNMLAAACIGLHFSVTLTNIKSALEAYSPSNFRSQIIKQNTNTIILDAYNANPTSMKAALSHFIGINHSSKILVLGEMYELGQQHLIEHQSIIELINEAVFKDILLIGNWPISTNEKVNVFSTTSDLREYLKNNKLMDSLVLVKGSRGVKLETIVEYL